MDLISLLGWIGTFFILLAYFLGANGILSATHWASLLLNTAGSLLVGYQMWVLSVWNALALNAIWFFIGLFALAKYLIGVHRNKEQRQ